MLPLILGMAGAYAMMGGAKTNPRRRAKKRRRNPKSLKDAEKFFYKNAGTSWTPGKETKEQGRRRGARELARAEQWAWENDVEYAWSPDPDADEPGQWQVVARKGREIIGSLGGVDFGGKDPWGQPYKRVIEAEIALEAMPRSNPKRRTRVSPSAAGGRLAKWRWHHNPRARKWGTEFIVQGNYGYGWDDEAAEGSRREALKRLREYRENGRGSYRLISRRVRIDGATNPGRKVGFADLARMSGNDLLSFWNRHQRGQNARALGYTGAGSRRLVADLANYAANLATARDCGRRGDAQGAKMYKRICTTIRSRHRSRR